MGWEMVLNQFHQKSQRPGIMLYLGILDHPLPSRYQYAYISLIKPLNCASFSNLFTNKHFLLLIV